jgi:GTPase SAR1 family protein
VVDPGGTALVGAAMWGQNLYNSYKPRKVGVYGAPMVGKTTLDRYLTTPGEMEEIDEDDRTIHKRILKLGKYRMPKPTRKRVSWQGEKRVVYSSDIGGQERFWNLWVEDMVTRGVEAIVYMFDDRAFKGGDDGLQQIAGFRYLVDCLIKRDYRYRSLWSRFRGRKYHPRVIMLVANKADRFFDETASKLWHDGRIGEHKIFDPFRDDLIRLQKAGIPTRRSFMATRIGWNVEKTMVSLLTS